MLNSKTKNKQLTMEGKQTTILVQNLLQVLRSNIWKFQQAVQVKAQYWQEAQAHISCKTVSTTLIKNGSIQLQY